MVKHSKMTKCQGPTLVTLIHACDPQTRAECIWMLYCLLFVFTFSFISTLIILRDQTLIGLGGKQQC